MTYLIRSTGALAVLWLAALAAPTALGQATAQPDPADATAPVPPTRYVPVPMPMTTARLAAPTSPAAHWKALNKTVAAYDAMLLSMEASGMATSAMDAPAAPKMAHPPAQSPASGTHPQHLPQEGK